MHSASKPWRAITSALSPWEMASHPSVAHRPDRQISLILFLRIDLPPDCVFHRGRDPTRVHMRSAASISAICRVSGSVFALPVGLRPAGDPPQ
jgi:hypothetical protein